MSENINYIRGFRRRANLTQTELAFLFGTKCGVKVSKYERRVRAPNLHSALAYQVVFRTPVDELFPDIYTEVETSVIERATVLLHELESSNTDKSVSEFKHDFLADVIAKRPIVERSELWENKKNMRFYLP